MATFTAINCKHQSGGAMRGTLDYVSQKKKTLWGDAQLVVGHNCVPQSAYTEMLTTKQRFRKTDGRQFYHFVQSFAEDDSITPAEANAIGLELAQREFPGFEVVIATHIDTNHIHNHLVVNSVSCTNGKKLHQSADDLLAHRKANDEICLAHGLNILEEPEKKSKMKRMKPGEYQAGLYADSWKLDLIQTINDVLEYARTPDEFIEGMEREGYQVTWTDTRKHITFTCPNGRRCRDTSLHDETILKENMEALFAYREIVGFQGEYAEPEIGWIGEASQGLLRLGKQLEQDADLPPLPTPPVWTDSKLRRREAMKKLAQGQKLSHDSHSQGQGMMGYWERSFMRTEFEEYISTGMLGTYHPESAVVRQMEDGSVDTVFSDTTQDGSAWDREMIIEGRVFHVTSVFAGEPTVTPTEKLLAFIDTELAKESRSA